MLSVNYCNYNFYWNNYTIINCKDKKFNNVNLEASKLLYASPEEDADTGDKIIKWDGHNWIVNAVDRYSQKGIIGLIASYDLTNKHGEAYGEIHIKRAGAVMYTLQFFVDVKKSNLPEGSKPETDILKLEQKLQKMNEDLGNVETLTMKNVENVVSAINKLDSRTENVLKSNKQLDKKEIDNILSIFNI